MKHFLCSRRKQSIALQTHIRKTGCWHMGVFGILVLSLFSIGVLDGLVLAQPSESAALVEKPTLGAKPKLGLFKKIAQKFLGKQGHSNRMSRTFEKGDIQVVVIKGQKVHVQIQGKEGSKIDVQTSATMTLNKKGTCLMIENEFCQGSLILPDGVRLAIEGGDVHVQLKDVIAEVDISGGNVHLDGSGKISKFTMHAGKAHGSLKGIMGNTFVHCGSAALTLGYQTESVEKMDGLVVPKYTREKNGSGENPYTASGLRLYQPAVKIYMHLGSGKVDLVFPQKTGVMYPKKKMGLVSAVRQQTKRAPFRLFPYSNGYGAVISLNYSTSQKNPQTANISESPQGWEKEQKK